MGIFLKEILCGTYSQGTSDNPLLRGRGPAGPGQAPSSAARYNPLQKEPAPGRLIWRVPWAGGVGGGGPAGALTPSGLYRAAEEGWGQGTGERVAPWPCTTSATLFPARQRSGPAVRTPRLLEGPRALQMSQVCRGVARMKRTRLLPVRRAGGWRTTGWLRTRLVGLRRSLASRRLESDAPTESRNHMLDPTWPHYAWHGLRRTLRCGPQEHGRVERAESDAALVELVDEGNKLASPPSEPVEVEYDADVALTQVVGPGDSVRLLGTGARAVVLEHTFAADLLESVGLAHAPTPPGTNTGTGGKAARDDTIARRPGRKPTTAPTRLVASAGMK